MQSALALSETSDSMTEAAPLVAGNPLAPTQEQAMVCDMISRFFRHNLEDSALGRDAITPEQWLELASLGLLAVIAPERADGLGGSMRDAVLMAEEFGRVLAISPFAESVVAATGLVATYGDQAMIERWVAPVLDGRLHLGWAPGHAAVGPDGSLTGELPVVLWGGQADGLVVPLSDAAYLVPVEAPGVHLAARTLIDGTPAAAVSLDRAQGERLPVPGGASASFAAQAQLCYVAEMVGTMALLHHQTAQYTQQRRQFGAAIATFQVVQHKLARMFVLLEQSRSSLLRAALCDPEDPDFIPAVASAKAYVAEAAQRLAEEAVQLHGGIGITDELVVGRGLRRVAVLARLFGSAEQARAQLRR